MALAQYLRHSEFPPCAMKAQACAEIAGFKKRARGVRYANIDLMRSISTDAIGKVLVFPYITRYCTLLAAECDVQFRLNHRPFLVRSKKSRSCPIRISDCHGGTRSEERR